MGKKSMRVSFVLAAVVSLTSHAANVAAQIQGPSDSQIKKVVTDNRTVEVTLGKPGSTEWSEPYKKYIWTRHFVAKLKTADPNVFVLEKGYAAYDMVGRNFVFWRVFVTSNGYDGIPDPTANDLQALVNKFGAAIFLGNLSSQLIGNVESINLAPDPKFDWQTQNSVSFDVVTVYLEKTDKGGKDRVRRTFRIQLFRDQQKADWKSIASTAGERKKL